MAGSGRGNAGVTVIDGDRPQCDRCGGFMKSTGRDWRCTNCRHSVIKVYRQDARNKYAHSDGFDTAIATKHARRCEKPVRLLVTSAQHNTPVHEGFFNSLKQAAKHFKCEIAVIPSHYKNITLFSKSDKKEWHSDIEPYLVKTDVNFGGVKVKSDVRINATTLNPLSGKSAHGHGKWLVFGHPQVMCEPVASPNAMRPNKLFTTGSITIPNYSQTNDGMKAEFHHVLGALIIERTKNGTCFVRQLNADDDGSFYDLDVKFTPKGVTKGHRILSIVTGDEHVKFNTVEKVTYGKAGIVETLQPKFIVRHDVLDGYAGSHHHDRDPVLQFAKHHNGDNDYRRELDECIAFINRTTPKTSKTLIVPSNHHDHLKKYLSKADANLDHQNSLFISEMQLAMRKAALAGENSDPFYLYAAPRLSCKCEFLDRNKPYLIGDVDHSQHFDVGTNGSRGSARGLAKTTYKMSGGHSHGARIYQGVFQAGTSTGRLDYENGLSDHSNTHIIQYSNSKRTLLDILDGKWRL